MGINWTGPWVNITAYNVGDAVSYLGSSYVAAFANTGVTPPNTPANSTVWNLLAAAGSVTLSSVPTSFIWQGVYSTLTAYYVNDCISYNGSSYICLANGVLNQEPDVSPFFWGILAEGGSGTTWGDIGGTLSNQTDLENILVGKQGTLTLTTSGTSGPATFTNGTLNIPIFAGGGSMTWPSTAGVAVYAGFSAWGTSLAAPSSALVGVSDTQTLTNKTVNGVTPTTMSYIDATSSIQTQLNGKDALGAAATAQANAETFSANASNITSGTVAAARLPVALSSSTSVNGTAIPASATLLTTAAAAATYAAIITLTTTGTSGAATYSGNTLNIPQYTSGGGSMTWPVAAGIAVYAGASAWGTSLTAPVGTIVGTTDTQTLTNKTIDGVTPTTMGYLDATSSIQTQLNGKQAALTLTTTGTSGAATLSSGTLNIPQYSGGSGASFVDCEVVSGSTGTTFTLAHTPVAGSLHLFRSGVRMYPTTDYTIAGTTITMGYSTTAGTLLADYLQSSGSTNFADSEIASGSTGTTFTLAHTPVSGSLHLFRSGVRVYPTTDYTISSGTITMNYSTTAGTLLADYRY